MSKTEDAKAEGENADKAAKTVDAAEAGVDAKAKGDDAAADDKGKSADSPEALEQEASSKTNEPAASDDDDSKYAELIPPRALPNHSATKSAPPPGLAPPGDSRSFRRSGDGEGEFCLLYRWHREVIVRRGPVGKWGTLKVTQYPSERSAATAYAHACSDLTAEGFYDLRE